MSHRSPPSAHPDLADDPGGWNDVLTRTGTPLATLFAAVAGRVDELSDLGVARIRATVEVYASASEGHRGDLWWSAKRSIQMMLTCLGQQRGLTDEDIANRRVLGRRAAEQGIPLESVMHAMRLGCILVWDALLETAEEQGPDAARSLLESAGLMWLSLDQLSSAIADGHRDARAARDQERQRRVLAFVAALRALPADPDRARAAASGLELDPDATFVWVAFEGGTTDAANAFAVMADSPRETLGLITGDPLDADDERRMAVSRVRSGSAPVGVGLARRGLLGARRSLVDAEQASHASRVTRRPSVCFRDDWMTCLVLASAGQLADVLAPAIDTLTTRPELRETVEAYLDNDGHLAATGRQVHLHPNSVAYRLSRFAATTGLDVRTSSGAAQVLAALALADRTSPRDGAP